MKQTFDGEIFHSWQGVRDRLNGRIYCPYCTNHDHGKEPGRGDCKNIILGIGQCECYDEEMHH